MSIRLLILGILYNDSSKHGYEIKQELESWNAELWASIAYGSIYFSLKQMTKENLIKKVSARHKKTIATARIIYTITPTGKAEFLRLLRNQWWQIKPLIDPFQVALTFMQHMPREEILLALDYRAGQVQTIIKSFELLAPQRLKETQAPRHIAENFKLMTAHMATELAWIEQIKIKIEQHRVP